MSKTDSGTRHEAIRSALARAAGRAPSATSIAAATVDAWHQIAARLEPVIGAGGVEVLLVRALHLTGRNFPWLDDAVDHGAGAALLAGLNARLAERTPDDAAQASQQILTTFNDLLATLIGESLTERLLGPVWAAAKPEVAQERAR